MGLLVAAWCRHRDGVDDAVVDSLAQAIAARGRCRRTEGSVAGGIPEARWREAVHPKVSVTPRGSEVADAQQ